MKKCLFLLLIWQGSWATVWYTDREIDTFLTQADSDANNLVTKMLTSQSPVETLKSWLTSETDPLNKEYQLFQLLDHWAHNTPDAHFDAALKQLTQYQSISTRSYHHAGPNHHEFIFPVASKARGVENIWLAHRSQQEAADIIAHHKQPWAALSDLLSRESRPIEFAVKQAIANAPSVQREALANHLLADTIWPIQASMAIAHLVTLQNDPTLSEKAIQMLPKMAAERVFRHLADQRDPELIELIIQSDKTQADPNFVASLLSQHQDIPAVVDHLIKQLSQPAAANGAAFALRQNNDPMLRLRLQQLQKNQPNEGMNKHIEFILQDPKQEQQR